MRQSLFLLGLVLLTSVGGYLVGTRRLGLSRRKIRAAVNKMLECIGAGLLFFAANLLLGVIIVFAGRSLTRGFVSVYFENDLSLLVLSLLQGLVFRWWKEVTGSNQQAAVSCKR